MRVTMHVFGRADGRQHAGAEINKRAWLLGCGHQILDSLSHFFGGSWLTQRRLQSCTPTVITRISRAKDGINVNVVLPGAVNTPFTTRILVRAQAAQAYRSACLHPSETAAIFGRLLPAPTNQLHKNTPLQIIHPQLHPVLKLAAHLS
jgi:hypothetical protein